MLKTLLLYYKLLHLPIPSVQHILDPPLVCQALAATNLISDNPAGVSGDGKSQSPVIGVSGEEGPL